MKKTTLASAAALTLGLACLGFASGAFAQAAAPAIPAAGAAVDAAKGAAMDAGADAMAKPKKMKPMKKMRAKAMPKVTVTVSNHSGLGLVELDAAMSGGADSAKIAGPLADGKKATVSVVHDKACLFDLHASFDDGSTSDGAGVDLCKERTINLTP